MRQNYKLQRFNRVVIALAILVLLTGGIFSAVKFLAPASEQVGAAEYITTYNSSGVRLLLSYDETYISSVYVPDNGTNRTWNTFTVYLKDGYQWKASLNEITVIYATSGSWTSSSDALKSLRNNLEDSTETANFARNGNVFTGSIGHSGGIKYPIIGIELSLNEDLHIDCLNYTLSFDFYQGNNNSPYSNITVTYTKVISYNGVVLPSASREGYVFAGWLFNGEVITNSTVWHWTQGGTAVAQWTLDGYTLAYSVDNDIGGPIGGESTQYAKNSSVTVTASPAEGYVFDHWVLNGTSATANPLTFTITQNSTLVAYFREIPNVTVTISGDIQCDIQKTVGDDAFIVVTPPTSNYVSSITIDGKVFPIQYYHANVYGAGEAHLIHYTVRDTSNTFSIYFENLFGSSTLEISLVNVKPTYQNPPLGGASVEGVATQATVGGETRVTGVDTSSANATVHLSAISYAGYVFTGWTASDGTDLSAYGSSADIPYSLIEGKIITANFTSTSNSSANGTTDNQDTPEII